MKKKLRVGVLLGGMSGEHEVSVISGASVIKALDKNKYKVIPIGISKNGKWISGIETVNYLKSKTHHQLQEKILLPDPGKKGLMTVKKAKITPNKPLDVVIPVLHGTYGEDGKIQGLLEMVNIAYVGAGVLGSAVGMDKIIMKDLFRQAGLKTVEYDYFLRKDWQKNSSKAIKQIESKLKYPVFIKPANLGSSVGINKAKNRLELREAIKDAVKYDRRIIVEEAVKNCREIECAVLGNDKPKASVLGEVLPSHEFYSYEAKYTDENGAKLEIPARLNSKIVREVQRIAVSAFKALDLAGMARVDFFLGKNQTIFINEVNTIPGFTEISMYPKLWQASGLSNKKLLDELIKLAMERHREKNKLKTSYKPTSDLLC